MNIFLSYAEEDGQFADLIARRLREAHVVFNWMEPSQRGKRFMQEIEEGIQAADAFLALLSPRFLRSDWCRREVEMAIHRERELKSLDPGATFINVMLVSPVRPAEAGNLGIYDWFDITNEDKRQPELTRLFAKFGPAAHPVVSSPHDEASGDAPPPVHRSDGRPPRPPQGEPVFRNRVDELRKVLDGVTNPGGTHFWLVVAPPQLGKSWFLQKISTHADLSEPNPWVVRLIDVRAQPNGVRGDPAALLALLFGLSSVGTIDQETLFNIAQEITESDRPHLCLLDSAELLTGDTVARLRACISTIYRLVQEAGRPDVRLAVVVGSRRDDEWRGVSPPPRLSPLPLTEFNSDVVQQAMRDLAAEMRRTFSQAEFKGNGTRVHRLTEGLPVLLVRCLHWVRTCQWVGMGRLETQRLFEELADPYVQDELLTPASLLPAGPEENHAPLLALVNAYRILAPYRIFTHAHLHHHLETDLGFRTALNAAGWDMPDLWAAINDTALLRRPLNEPWQEIHAAIRRLLYRYFYKTAEHRIQAHNEARKFVEIWTEGQIGTEQGVGLVECLWHEATALGLSKSAEKGHRLAESARKLSLEIRQSPAYTSPELRDFAALRMGRDEELQEAVGNDRLFEQLVAIVVAPEEPQHER